MSGTNTTLRIKEVAKEIANLGLKHVTASTIEALGIVPKGSGKQYVEALLHEGYLAVFSTTGRERSFTIVRKVSASPPPPVISPPSAEKSLPDKLTADEQDELEKNLWKLFEDPFKNFFDD